MTVRNKLCTKDIELLAVNLRPCYLPHEMNQLCIFIVAQAEAKFPDTAMFILGDFNLCSLTEQLPTYHQCVSCPTRDGACLDLCCGNTENAYCAKALPGLGKLDHNMIRLITVYRSFHSGKRSRQGWLDAGLRTQKQLCRDAWTALTGM